MLLVRWLPDQNDVPSGSRFNANHQSSVICDFPPAGRSVTPAITPYVLTTLFESSISLMSLKSATSAPSLPSPTPSNRNAYAELPDKFAYSDGFVADGGCVVSN